MAAADYRASLLVAPDSADAANELAWCPASPSQVEGNAEEAIAWRAEGRLKLVPESHPFETPWEWPFTAGRFAEAAAELEQNSLGTQTDRLRLGLSVDVPATAGTGTPGAQLPWPMRLRWRTRRARMARLEASRVRRLAPRGRVASGRSPPRPTRRRIRSR